jgi:Flp pilus assembly protein TadG
MTAANITRCRRRFLRNEDGATAVEFALVAAPFLALLMGIIQTFLVFLAGQELQTAVTKTSRMILTGQVQNGNISQSTFTNDLCANLSSMFTCGNLMVDVEAYSSFSSANATTPALTYNANGTVKNTWQYNPGTAGQIVVVRAMYQWTVFGGPLNFSLSNLSNGSRLLMGVAAFKNEPYQ